MSTLPPTADHSPDREARSAAVADQSAAQRLLALPLAVFDESVAEARSEAPDLPQLSAEQRRELQTSLAYNPVPVAQAQAQAQERAPVQPDPPLAAPLQEQLATHQALGELGDSARELGEVASTGVALLDDAAGDLEGKLMEVLRRQLVSSLPATEKQRWLDRFMPLLRLRPEGNPRNSNPLVLRLKAEAEGGRSAKDRKSVV